MPNDQQPYKKTSFVYEAQIPAPALTIASIEQNGTQQEVTV